MQLRTFSAILLTGAMLSTSSAVAQVAAPEPPVTRPALPDDIIPKMKQTALGLYTTPREAAETMRTQGATTLFVDVRTRAEMAFTGWAPMIDGHVPFVDVTEFWDWDDREGRYKLEANATFSRDVEALLNAKGLTKADRVILMCRSGDRSARDREAHRGRVYASVQSARRVRG